MDDNIRQLMDLRIIEIEKLLALFKESCTIIHPYISLISLYI